MATIIQVKIITPIFLIHIIPFSRENELVCAQLGESPRAPQDKNDGLHLQPMPPNAKISRVQQYVQHLSVGVLFTPKLGYECQDQVSANDPVTCWDSPCCTISWKDDSVTSNQAAKPDPGLQPLFVTETCTVCSGPAATAYAWQPYSEAEKEWQQVNNSLSQDFACMADSSCLYCRTQL